MTIIAINIMCQMSVGIEVKLTHRTSILLEQEAPISWLQTV